MTEFITAGGPFMWPLLACSILIITIAVERLWFLQIRLVSPNGLTNQIVNLFNKDLINNKQAEEISDLSSLGFLLISCIKYKDLPRENLESKIEGQFALKSTSVMRAIIDNRTFNLHQLGATNWL